MNRPSMPAGALRAEMVQDLAAEVASHPQRDRLAALAYDVLCRQAEGKVLYAGREFVARRAAAHGIDRDEATTRAGNLVAILERGPETESERATATAFAVHGFGRRVAAASPEDVPSLLSRFVRHADWLELATPYAVLVFVDPVLPAEFAARLWGELARSVIDEASGPNGSSAPSRARNAARLTALAASQAEAAHAGLSAVAHTSTIDAPTRALAVTLCGDRQALPVREPTKIRGRVVRARRSWLVTSLGWLSGWALIVWALRALAALLGARREAEIAVVERGVEVREESFFLGRKIGESVWTLATSAILEAGREVRYPALHLHVGFAALAAGMLIGGLVLLDGLRSGEPTLMLVGAGLALGGATLDLALDVLGPGRRAQVVVALRAEPGRALRVGAVPLEQADRFLVELRNLARRV